MKLFVVISVFSLHLFTLLTAQTIGIVDMQRIYDTDKEVQNAKKIASKVGSKTNNISWSIEDLMTHEHQIEARIKSIDLYLY